MLAKIALRNIFRNRRRSTVTGLAVAVGATALLVFGAFQAYVFAGLQTGIVQRSGHLTVFRDGYFLFGAGNPAAYGIDDYKSVMRLIADDSALKPLINVMTPTLSLFGIAGNFEGGHDAAKTFFGVGVVPSDRERMRQWNEFGAGRPYEPDAKLTDADPTRGFVGVGLARILGLCARLGVPNCPAPPDAPPDPSAEANAGPPQDFSDLTRRDIRPTAAGALPRLDLLGATAGGAPNVLSLYVSGAEAQPARELDDSFVAMHLELAQQLLYGRGEHKVTGIVIQLHHSADLGRVRAHLVGLFKSHNLPLDVRDFTELAPQYGQIVGFFSAIFLFIAVIMGVIVLFTVVNTMTMAVMERTNEIGTTRALGVRRAGIRRQFLLEGWMLGAIGASVGVALAFLIAFAANHANLSWTPPGNVTSVPLRLYLSGRWPLLGGTWLGLVVVATLASLFPANRAARLPVVDALRHV
ncbi:MAG TPA: FtsX-like permease family protein [Candidatus Sulfotelmatobacter sp.]|nr:FtsX-like permease family protein [Candidatus Sulfotelmatobacter sp.]